MTTIAIQRRAIVGLPSRALALVLAATLVTGIAFAGGPSEPEPRAGVIVDGTSGLDLAALAAAKADVKRLRANEVTAELRVTRTPSESLAAAATLAARGATTLIVRGVDARSVLAPLQRSHPGLHIVVR
jgi:ABC-type sugar transport system substrate-binding protein